MSLIEYLTVSILYYAALNNLKSFYIACKCSTITLILIHFKLNICKFADMIFLALLVILCHLWFLYDDGNSLLTFLHAFNWFIESI